MRPSFFIAPVAYILLTTLPVTSLFAHGLSHQRLHLLNHEIIDYPQDPTLLIKRGQIFQETKQWNAALTDYTKALTIDPTFYKALYWQGFVLQQKGEYELAKNKLQQFLTHNQTSPAGHKTLAKVYTQLNKNIKAADQYDQAISNDKSPPPQIYLERAHSLFKISPIPAKRISNGLQDAIKQHGSLITYSELLIDLNIKTKNYQRAISWIEKLPENLQQSPQWLNKKADTEKLAGNHKKALNLYQRCIKEISNMSPNKQNLPIFITFRQQAEKEIRYLHIENKQ
jgi:tetratricopeptide (TPR) repeat protein